MHQWFMVHGFGCERTGSWLLGAHGRALSISLMLVVQAGILSFSALRHSPTHLEPAFLAAGISHWHFGRFELYRVNPPLPRMIAALPAVTFGCETNWARYRDGPGSRSEFAVGKDFVKANGLQTTELVLYGRLFCIPVACLGAFFAYLLAEELYGNGAGHLAMLLWVLEPNVLAHSELITPDSACLSFGLGAIYWFVRWLKQPNWCRAVIAGMFLGLAELSKMTWLILFPLWPIVWAVNSLFEWRKTSKAISCRQQGLQLLALISVALYCLNLGYAFDGSLSRLNQFQFVSTSFTGLDTSGHVGNRFVGTWVETIPVPLPKQFVLGLDSQKRDFESFVPPSYLRGNWSDRGWWYYYLYGALIKTPCAYHLLFLIIVVNRLRWDGFVFSRQELIVICPALLLFVVASLQTEINSHVRYVLPSIGIAIVFLGQATSCIRHCRLSRLLVTAALIWCTVATTRSYPHQLAYFNEYVGGPANGHCHLLGSNLDWGQDMLFLRDYLRGTGERALIASTELSQSLESLGLSKLGEEIGESSFLDGNYPRNTTIVVPVTTLCRSKELQRAVTAGCVSVDGDSVVVKRLPSCLSLYCVRRIDNDPLSILRTSTRSPVVEATLALP